MCLRGRQRVGRSYGSHRACADGSQGRRANRRLFAYPSTADKGDLDKGALAATAASDPNGAVISTTDQPQSTSMTEPSKS